VTDTTAALSIRERASRSNYDAVVVGAGPNGLAAAITLARRGLSVLVVEGAATVGGGCRSAEWTLPGFVHDTCSAIHPLGYGSPIFRSMPLHRFGLQWIQPPAPLAHPLDHGAAVLLQRSVEATADGLGGVDGKTWARRIGGLVPDWDVLGDSLLQPWKLAKDPFGLARFGLPAIRSAHALADAWFVGSHAKALFAGIAAHSMLPLEQSPSAAIGLVLAIAGHAVGWPLPRGGSQRLSDALTAYLVSLGGEVLTGGEVRSLDDLPTARATFLEVSPAALVRLAGDRLPAWYRRRLERFRRGPAAFKLDYALDGPVPWRSPDVAQAATVHLGGTLAEIAEAERETADGGHPERPYILLAQQSLFDPTRVPEGKHTVWAYCHVPNGSGVDMSDRIEGQIERFAPGFRDRILARYVSGPHDLERYNPNYRGGDINGGVLDWPQLLLRPALTPVPWRVPANGPGLYLCSASTPPGGGVHGMCGYWAALTALTAERF
jgi:phytoene dehydrogenase-like protein